MKLEINVIVVKQLSFKLINTLFMLCYCCTNYVVFGFLDCCWAVVSSAATEALYNIKNRSKKPFQRAPQEMINCLKKNRTTCYTSSINEGFRFAKEFGVRREVDCPFLATKQPCHNKLEKMVILYLFLLWKEYFTYCFFI